MLMRFAETAEPSNPGDYDHGQDSQRDRSPCPERGHGDRDPRIVTPYRTGRPSVGFVPSRPSQRALAATDAALLDAVSPPQGQEVMITTDHDRLTADLRAAESNLDAAQATHRAAAARLPLAHVNPVRGCPTRRSRNGARS
jgi:hypothetical protein